MFRRHSEPRFDRHAPVVVAGGGVAGLEAVLALRAASDDVAITLIAPQPRFTYRPLSVLEGFGGARPVHIDLAAFAREHGVTLVPDRLAAVDADRRVARTETGEELPYAALLLAIGGERVPGLRGAQSFGGSADVPALDGLLDHLEFGESASIAFVNAGAEDWALPLYELALLTRDRLRERGRGDVRVSIVTAEELPLAALGLDAADMAQMLLRGNGIRVHCGVVAQGVDGREILLDDGRTLHADHVIALPRLRVGPIGGLPQGADGFVAIDEHAAVLGLSGVFAAGDMTAGFPKQGGIGARQADAAVDAILVGMGLCERAQPFTPELQGVLLTPAVLEHAGNRDGRRPPTKIVAPHLAAYLGTRDADSLDPASWRRQGTSPFPTEIALG